MEVLKMLAEHTTATTNSQMLSLDWVSAKQAPLPPGGGDEAVAHMASIDDDGVHHFTAIRPDVGPVAYLNFRLPRDAAKARAWVNGLDGEANIHYTLNEVQEGCDEVKPRKTDIVAIRAAHGDVDLPGANTEDAVAALVSRSMRSCQSRPAPCCRLAAACS